MYEIIDNASSAADGYIVYIKHLKYINNFYSSYWSFILNAYQTKF